jgi:hypothetical protein
VEVGYYIYRLIASHLTDLGQDSESEFQIRKIVYSVESEIANSSLGICNLQEKAHENLNDGMGTYNIQLVLYP